MFTIMRFFKKKQARKTNDALALIFKVILVLGTLAGVAYAGYKIYQKIQKKRMSSFCCCDGDDCCECDELIVEDFAEEVPADIAE